MTIDPLILQMMQQDNSDEKNQALLNSLQNNDTLSSKSKMLLQLMSAGNKANTDYDVDDEYKTEKTVSRRQIRNKFYALQDELEEALAMIDVLADAIGACPYCFGEQNDCAECHGEGIAGWQQPDPELFTHFIAPAVRRIKKQSNPVRKKETSETE